MAPTQASAQDMDATACARPTQGLSAKNALTLATQYVLGKTPGTDEPVDDAYAG
jgi:hypothetical protein